MSATTVSKMGAEQATKATMSPARTMGASSLEVGANLAASLDPFDIKQELARAPRPVEGERSQIVDFYANRSVLITGASGFIGKVLIEKLLRTCPSIRRIFVLIRPKWNKKPEDRLRELLEAPLFEGIRNGINLSKRIQLVEGDVTQPNLGLNGNNLSKIIKEVSVIFHSAATVKFDEPLKQSVAINIAGTKNMIEICRRIPQLAALVHISTAYANCDRDEVEEYVYPMEMDPEKLIQMADWLDQDTLQELKRRLLGGRPNTYTYTKALAEWLLVRSARDLPVVVCRPSIVVASHREPFKGWIDNVNGPTGVILGAGKGLVRSMFAEKSFVADLVPVDVVINLVVALAWFAHINKGQKQQLNETMESFTDSILSGRSTSPSASACSNSSSAASISGDDQYDHFEQHHSLVMLPDKSPSRQLPDVCSSSDSSDLHSAASSQQDTKLHNQQQQQQQQQQQHNQQQQQQQRRQRLDKWKGCPQATLSSQASSLDDGYGSLRSSDYNSLASSDTASTSSSASLTHRAHKPQQHHNHHQLTTTQHSHQHSHHHGHHHSHHHHHNHHHRRRQSRPAIKISSCSAIIEQQQQQQQQQQIATDEPMLSGQHHGQVSSSVGNPMEIQFANSVNNDSNNNNDINNDATDISLNDDGHNNDEPSTPTLEDQELQAKLKQLRQKTKSKLNQSQLPEELADVPVFHCTSGSENPITWGQIQLLIMASLVIYPSSTTYRYPCGSFTNKKFLDDFYRLTLHYIPAYIVDFLTKLSGGKPIIVRIYNKFDQAASVLKDFTSKQWKFNYDNRLFLLNELMNEEDRRLFNFDTRPLKWDKFLGDYVLGVRKFMLKESMDSLEKARSNLKMIYYRNLSLQVLFLATSAYYLLSKCSNLL